MQQDDESPISLGEVSFNLVQSCIVLCQSVVGFITTLLALLLEVTLIIYRSCSNRSWKYAKRALSNLIVSEVAAIKIWIPMLWMQFQTPTNLTRSETSQLINSLIPDDAKPRFDKREAAIKKFENEVGPVPTLNLEPKLEK